MPALSVSNASSNSVKRQRSQEIPLVPSIPATRPTSAGQGPANGSRGQLDDSARQMTVKIPQYLKKSRAKISIAFQDLEWKQRYRIQDALQHPETSPFRVDTSLAVISRNRYSNVQPWDSSRVKLKKPIGGSDYVNASPISLKSRATNSKSRSGGSTPASVDQSSRSGITKIESRYIATQGPKEGQFSHFWHMVMQETTGDVGVIIMLTRLYEGHREKCSQYFPSDMDNPTLVLPAHEGGGEDEGTEEEDNGDPFLDSPTTSADADSLGAGSEPDQPVPPTEGTDEAQASSETQSQPGSVTLLSLHYDSTLACEVRKLRLTIDDETKEIFHYLFNGWPDYGKPEAEDRLALLELTKVSKSVAGDSPRVVHCSAGVGRTGTWIALDFLLQELDAGRMVYSAQHSNASTPTSTPSNASGTWGRSGPSKVTTPDSKDEDDLVWETVNTLREQRMMMVMNELQYSFLYEVLKDAFIEKYAEKETGPIVVEAQEPSPKVARKKSPFGGMFQESQAGTVRAEEGTVSEVEMESEAETEIIDKVGMDVDDALDPSSGDQENDENVENDPYAAVGPENFQRGKKQDEQDEVHDYEVK